MGEYYIIAAGGTGAMCARSFIYMAAAGCADNGSTYNILLMDKDKESDAMTACENLLSDYEDMRRQLGIKPGTFTFPKIRLHKWNFTEEITAEYQKQTGKPASDLKSLTLNKLLNPSEDPKIAQIMATMYTAEEMNVDLEKGFYGHPNIGAPVFDYVRDRFLGTPNTKNTGVMSNTFMNSLRQSLERGKAYVYLFGSLFGGTGATVIPNVVLALRTIQDANGQPVGRTNLVLGASVIMPYFRLPGYPANSVEALAKVAPVDNKFAGQTREALEYYHESGLLSNMMNLMLLGTSVLDVTSEIFARGGRQTQHFHTVLLLAGAAANRFFGDRLGNMAQETGKDVVTPLGELMVWKMTPDDPAHAGVYQTLTPGELGLGDEYKKLAAFLRFSVVVNYYMRDRFQMSADNLKYEVEILGTAKQMIKDGRALNPNPKTMEKADIEECYKEPVAKAGAICRGFIEFMYDVALSGYDWSQHRELVIDQNVAPTEVNGNNYFVYKPGALCGNSGARSKARWMDFANLPELKRLLETTSLDQVIQQTTLNNIVSYEMLDQGRTAYIEREYPNSIAQVYLQDVLPELGLVKNFFGHMKRDDVYFCEIYDRLYKACTKRVGGEV